jgi:hypothetical protein
MLLTSPQFQAIEEMCLRQPLRREWIDGTNSNQPEACQKPFFTAGSS